MMDSWRRQRGESDHREVQETRSNPRKSIDWKLAAKVQTVPSWEKKFCFLVGSVPWKKLVETKQYMHLYENVVNWNDSAGEEAFQNAKSRFWAEINGLPCDLPSPDPDSYIDKIDWDSKTDQELIKDRNAPDEGHRDENVVIIEDPLLLNPTFSCVGLGEEAGEDCKKKTGPSLFDNVYNVKNGCSDRFWDREGDGLNLSRYKTSRYHGDEYQVSRGGRRLNLSYDRLFLERRSSRQWQASYCRPDSHRIYNKARNSWGC